MAPAVELQTSARRPDDRHEVKVAVRASHDVRQGLVSVRNLDRSVDRFTETTAQIPLRTISWKMNVSVWIVRKVPGLTKTPPITAL